MKYIVSLIIIPAALIILITACTKTAYQKAYVASPEGIDLRERPGRNSKLIMEIPYKATVIIIDDTGKDDTINGVRGRWNRVGYYGFYGWAFDGFLERDINAMPQGPIKRSYILGRDEVTYNAPGTMGITFKPDGKAVVGFDTCTDIFRLKGTYTADNDYVRIKIKKSSASLQHQIDSDIVIVMKKISHDRLFVENTVSYTDSNKKTRYKLGFCKPRKGNIYTIKKADSGE